METIILSQYGNQYHDMRANITIWEPLSQDEYSHDYHSTPILASSQVAWGRGYPHTVLSIPQTPHHTICKSNMAPWSSAQRHRRRSWQWTMGRWSCSPGRCTRQRSRGETAPQCAADSRNSTNQNSGMDAQGESPGIGNGGGRTGRETRYDVCPRSQPMFESPLPQSYYNSGANKHTCISSVKLQLYSIMKSDWSGTWLLLSIDATYHGFYCVRKLLTYTMTITALWSVSTRKPGCLSYSWTDSSNENYESWKASGPWTQPSCLYVQTHCHSYRLK